MCLTRRAAQKNLKNLNHLNCCWEEEDQHLDGIGLNTKVGRNDYACLIQYICIYIYFVCILTRENKKASRNTDDEMMPELKWIHTHTHMHTHTRTYTECDLFQWQSLTEKCFSPCSLCFGARVAYHWSRAPQRSIIVGLRNQKQQSNRVPPNGRAVQRNRGRSITTGIDSSSINSMDADDRKLWNKNFVDRITSYILVVLLIRFPCAIKSI